MPKIIIVGGGVIGCAIAHRLTRDGHQVKLFERDRVGAHASGAAAGLLAPYSEGWGSERLSELAAESLKLFPELVDRLRAEGGIDVEYREQESLRVALDQNEAADAQNLVSRLQQRGVEAHWLDPEAAREAEPELSPEVRGAALVHESQITPPRFVEGLARAAVNGGASVRQATPVVRLLGNSERIDAVQLPTGREQADWVVVAAGPWSPEVVASLDLQLDVQPRRGQLVALIPDRPSISHILTRATYYLVPKPDGSVVAGSTEEEMGFDARATVAGVHELLEVTQRAVPSLKDATVSRVWAGIRPWTPSGLPLIGPAPGYDNLILATGHHRDGILLAPITAEWVAQGVAGAWGRLD